MAQVHNLLLTLGKEAAIQTDIARSVVEAAAGYLSSEDTDIGYLFSGWAQAALPHRRLPDDQAWQVTTDRGDVNRPTRLTSWRRWAADFCRGALRLPRSPDPALSAN